MAKSYSITRTNPRTGRLERPWRNREGKFVLGDPAHGAQKHHDQFAVKVETLEEVAAYVARGFSVRMTDGQSPPSLISPDSLTVKELTDENPQQLWAETRSPPPFSKAEMFEELKRVFLVQANQIAHAGSLDFARAFMGFETKNPNYPYCEDDIAQVDLDRFAATHYMDRAYDFAFQVGRYWGFGGDIAQDLNEFVQGANPQSSDGWQSPIANPDSKVRRTADMAFARWKIADGSNLAIRELALLAGDMSEAAVRNSLSKEKIAVTKGEVDLDAAVAWLQPRRGFVPTRTEEGRKESWTVWARGLIEQDGLAKAMPMLLKELGFSADALAANAQVPPPFVAALLEGRPMPDVDALRRIGAALDLDVPHFVGVAIQAALRTEGAA